MAGNTYINVQTDDFDLSKEYQVLRDNNPHDGAIVTFVGLVRDFNQTSQVQGLFLEHYPSMTEKSLLDICQQARQRWPLGGITIIHRVGRLTSAEQIVMVGVTSKHREAAYLANQFIMDYLKTQAPFWKKELTNNGDVWVQAKRSDKRKAQCWK
jgi:molybdopterin synthase catalytic subunit